MLPIVFFCGVFEENHFFENQKNYSSFAFIVAEDTKKIELGREDNTEIRGYYI
jgi:hypothetical protein